MIMKSFNVKNWFSGKNEKDDVVVSVDVWYDRHIRLWVIQRKNHNGDQIGTVDYAYYKQQALEIEADYKKEYGIS